MAMSALSRPFTLGMLYNAYKDELIPGVTLWDEATIQQSTVRSLQHSSEFEIIASDSLEDKSSLLDVNASLKASFLGGLIEVEGSAKYLDDKKKFHNQSRVTCQYKTTTDFKQLAITQLPATNAQQIDVTKKGLATHVVTGILYGANAVFVFDSEKLEDSSIQDIQGSMQAVIKKIPSFNIEGKVDIKLSEKEKNLTNKFSCKFYGDFILDNNPTTFEDAVKTFVQLPKLLGQNGENGVPLKVWLMPLKNLFAMTDQVMTGISPGLVRKAQDALEDLHHFEKECNSFLEDNRFTQIQEKLTRFLTLCVYFRSALGQAMALKLPLIRAGHEDERNLEKVFDDIEKSPFSHEKLTKWIEDKKREVSVIRSCMVTMEGIKIVTSQSELDKEVLTPGVEDALCFVFTSVETTDCYLQELTDYVDKFQLPVAASTAPPTQDQWYYSNEVITKIRAKAKVFQDLGKALKNSSRFRFLVAAIQNEKFNGATIYHYRNGALISDEFSQPDINNVEAVTDRKDLIWYACDLTLDPDTAHVNLSLSKGNQKATKGEPQSYPDLPQRFDCFTQILCKEGLTGRCYWEVEWSTGVSEDVSVGVCYRGQYRKGDDYLCNLGRNSLSWCFGHLWDSPSGASLYKLYDQDLSYLPAPPTGCTRLGVFLDWSAGTLSYYNVSADTVSHLHTYNTKFSEPVYPAFGIYKDHNYVFLTL